MRSAGVLCLLLFCALLVAGCIDLPGFHVISDTPDPIIGQWIGGEPPASESHVIFYENRTFFSANFFINRGEATDTGNWTRQIPGRYSLHSVSGETTYWRFDSYDDAIYQQTLPQMIYHRYKG